MAKTLERKATREEDLAPVGEWILGLWKTYRPKVVAALTKTGDLFEEVKAAEQSFLRMLDDQLRAGVSPAQARLNARSEYIDLPDLGEESPDEAPPDGQTTDSPPTSE